MKSFVRLATCLLIWAAFFADAYEHWFVQPASAQQTFESIVGKTTVGPVLDSGSIQVPIITWGGDVATLVANGGLSTTPNSIYGQEGLNLKIKLQDDFKQQVRDYMSGKSPYLRGTVHMISLASQIINSDPRTKPVMVVQLTWSAGDHIVARKNIKSLNDLKGKKICLQEGGPHLGLLDDSLKAVNMSWDDVKVVYVKDLTGKDGPAEAMRKDPTIDAACVISPDMIGLCSGLDQVGSGADDTIAGAHVVNSTSTMSHSIADVYVVRSDYYKANKDKVEKFVVGFLKGVEQLLEHKKQYNDGKGKSPEYMAALKMAQQVFTAEVLPTLENDAHGLVSDATFVRIPGNESFFTDPNNLTGFVAKQKGGLDMAAKLGFITDRFGWEKSDWDYRKISQLVGVNYVPPVMATGRIRSEVVDFSKDLDTNTIFSFEIHFEPEQATFPIESYASDFQRLCESSQTFGNAVILIRGHSDPTLALRNFFWASQAKGLLTGQNGSYKFKGQPIDLTDPTALSLAIQSENFSGQSRRSSDGQVVQIDDPKTTVAAALQLSQTRAMVVKRAIEEYAKSKKYTVDLSQIQPQGVGIAEPIHAWPRNSGQAKENMRVEFRVIKVSAEALNEDTFNFDK